jgi:hypothetical protein
MKLRAAFPDHDRKKEVKREKERNIGYTNKMEISSYIINRPA